MSSSRSRRSLNEANSLLLLLLSIAKSSLDHDSMTELFVRICAHSLGATPIELPTAKGTHTAFATTREVVWFGLSFFLSTGSSRSPVRLQYARAAVTLSEEKFWIATDFSSR